jgi:hydroxyethylthiazole kinase
MTTSLVGTFCGVTKDYYTASIAGIISMGLAGEIAQVSLHHGEGIGTFRARLLDSIYNLTPEILARDGKISYE